MEKKCFKCGEVKSLSDFYKHKGMKDGHLNKCKMCNKEDVKKNRDKNIDYYREYDRGRGCRQSPEYFCSWKKSNPIKRAAHMILHAHLKSGKVKKKYNCEECGIKHEKIHGHHDDYALPLSVRWLCPSCHKLWHNENGEGKNAH